jgi:hypothetical protein
MATQTVNLKLVESRLQAIAALSVEEQHIVRSRLILPPYCNHPKMERFRPPGRSPSTSTRSNLEEIDCDLQAEHDAWDR